MPSTFAPFRFATLQGSSRSTEDRVHVAERGDALVVVVADGAGGMRGGAVASDALVSAVQSKLANERLDPYDVRAWSEVFQETDAALAKVLGGETTGVLVVVGEQGVVGVSTGDSEAWVVATGSIDRLTETQARKRVGSGCCVATPFHRRRLEGTLVVATDGLFNYVTSAAVTAACVASVGDAAERLAALPRLASGAYPDDVAIVVVASAGAR